LESPSFRYSFANQIENHKTRGVIKFSAYGEGVPGDWSNSMSKHKRAGDKKDKVGKAGSPPSGTENERPPEGKEKERGQPDVSKREVGEPDGKPLH
jgi:hypothetical protein